MIAITLLAIAVGSFFRLAPVGEALLFGDEFHSLRGLDKGYAHLVSHFGTTGAGMALPILQRALADLFGSSHWTIRAPAWIAGLGLLWSFYPLARRWVGADAARIATVLVALSSSLIFYSHVGRAYALSTWLGFLFVCVCGRVLDGISFSRSGPVFVLLVAILPYVHLTSLSLVLPAAIATIGVLFFESRGREGVRICGALVLGTALALLLHWPALDGVLRFFQEKTGANYEGAFGVVDVLGLLVGNRAGGALSCLLFAGGAIAVFGRMGARSLPLLASCLGPVVALLVVQPFGGPYAYMRYVVIVLPMAWLVVSWLLVCAIERARFALARQVVAVVFAVGLFAVGPAVQNHASGLHANTFMGLYTLPAFDQPWTGGSEFYAELARIEEPVRIIEAPGLVTRTRHLHRIHYLDHGKDTRLALYPFEIESIPGGPYVSLFEDDWRANSDADFLILHLRIEDEVDAYWSFVYETHGASVGRDDVAAYMDRQKRRTWYPKAESTVKLQRKLRDELGPPAYQDTWLWAWDLQGRTR